MSLSVGKYFFLRIPSPRIPRQVGRVQISRSCDFFKARYPAAGIFMTLSLYFFPKKPCIYKFVNSENTCGWKIFFCEYHRLEYRDRLVKVKCQGRDLFLSEISSRRAKVPRSMTLSSPGPGPDSRLSITYYVIDLLLTED